MENSRRELFGSIASAFTGRNRTKDTIVPRPPYYKDLTSFGKSCSECDGRCVQVCDEGIIKIGGDKIPYLDFTSGGCTYCDKCAIACDRDELKLEYKSKIDITFEIDMLSCLSYNQTMCFSCKDPCLDNAIKFLGLFRPEINSDLCSSCGFCLSRCPTNAIKIVKSTTKKGSYHD